MFKVVNREINKIRKFETKDIVRRRIVITAKQVKLLNHPVGEATTIFNPSLLIDDKDGIRLYARIVLGYFSYASAVAELRLSVQDIYTPPINYDANLILYPGSKYDFWGVEDPRAYRFEGRAFITYSGRTVSYFNPAVRIERTLPVNAILTDDGWKKTHVFRLPKQIRQFVVSDKDAFLLKANKKVLLFHRPHLSDDSFYLAISEVSHDLLKIGNGVKNVVVNNTRTAFEPSKFEIKLGWSTPPIEVEDKYLVLLHGVDVEIQAYRVFAILLNDRGEIIAVSPFYIMEPKESYEIYGDRPYTIFPCGAQKIDDSIIVSYGAADSVIGIGEIKVDELLGILDKGRLC